MIIFDDLSTLPAQLPLCSFVSFVVKALTPLTFVSFVVSELYWLHVDLS
jgi:hypothetical protein